MCKRQKTHAWSKAEGTLNESGTSIVKPRAIIKIPHRLWKTDTEDKVETEGAETQVREQGHVQVRRHRGVRRRSWKARSRGESARTCVVAAGASSPRGLEADMKGWGHTAIDLVYFILSSFIFHFIFISFYVTFSFHCIFLFLLYGLR